MLHEDAGAHENQDGAAGKLGLALEAGAEHTAHPGAQRGQGEGDDADEAHGGNDVHLQEGEGDAHRQRVDASPSLSVAYLAVALSLSELPRPQFFPPLRVQ